jgi:hypothetical protein
MGAQQLIRALSRALRIAPVLLLVALPSCGEERQGRAPSLRPTALAALPPAARHDVASLRHSLGGGRLRVRAYRSTRHAALASLAPDAPLVGADLPVAVVTFSGPLTYRRARTPPGGSSFVRGRFAYSTYGEGDGAPLDLGVLPRPPRTGSDAP